MRKFYALLAILTFSMVNGNAQKYITKVLEFTPAPGQFMNKAPGLPTSAESIIGKNNGLVSLGAFGGTIIFQFEEAVKNHPDNPYGVDFIIFGNALRTWSEPGIVWVMKDENGNGLPDDTWYQLAGSEYHFSTTKHSYSVTYTNPNTEEAAMVPWADNQGNTGFIQVNSFHNQPYYPLPTNYPEIPQDSYTLSGTLVAAEVDQSNPAMITIERKAFGYADNVPRGKHPFNIPDNPYTSDIENGGGDGFDISWAVDNHGNYVELDEIHFVKVQTGVLDNVSILGEVSTEIAGAVVVEPDPTLTGTVEIVVVNSLPKTIWQDDFQVEAMAFRKGRPVNDLEIQWELLMNDMPVTNDEVTLTKDLKLSFTQEGELTINFWLADYPETIKTVSTLLKFTAEEEEPNSISSTKILPKVVILPNPATDYITIQGIENAIIQLYSITGVAVIQLQSYTYPQEINVSHLPKGVYLARITERNGKSITLKFIKR